MAGGEAEERACWTCCARYSFRSGPSVPAFEQAFAARVGAPWGAPCRAGPLGCTLRCGPLGWGMATRSLPARFRLSPRLTPLCMSGRGLVFADIDPVTLNLDPEAAAAAVTERTRALLPVHIFGYPADLAGV